MLLEIPRKCLLRWGANPQATGSGKPYPCQMDSKGKDQPTGCDIFALLGVTPDVGYGMDAASYGRLYRDQAAMLRRRAWRYLRDDRAAEEVVQEAFLRVIQAAPEFSDEGHAIAYLSTTVTNICLNRYRDAGRRPRLIALDTDVVAEHLDQVSAQTHRDREFDLSEQGRSQAIQQAITQLPAAQRFALVMYEIHDRSFEEIAEYLRIKPSSVRTVLSRARAGLRAILEEQAENRDLRPADGDFGLSESAGA